jgi:TolB protein
MLSRHFIPILMLGVAFGCGSPPPTSDQINTSAVQPTETTHAFALREAESATTDCKRIIFSYSILDEHESELNVASICPDGTDLRWLTSDAHGNSHPEWSPDGRQIAFLSGHSQNDLAPQLHVMDHDGSNVRQFTSSLRISRLLWLPSGGEIAILISDGKGLWRWEILNAETLAIRPITGWSYDFFFRTPAYSHDGTRIAYMSLVEQAERNDGSSQIHISNIDGSNDYAITSDIWANISPVWSPDDSQIAFLSERDGTYNQFALYVVNVDGSGLRRITLPVLSDAALFTWSPDGKAIAIHDIFVTEGSILIFDLETGVSRALFTTEEPENYISWLSWQP